MSNRHSTPGRSDIARLRDLRSVGRGAPHQLSECVCARLRTVENDMLWRACVHESGHAVFASLMQRRIAYVSVVPSRDTLGRTVFAEKQLIDARNLRLLEREAALFLSGFVAELLHDARHVPSGCNEDINYAWTILVDAGYSPEQFAQVVQRTTRMLRTIWPCVLATANELQKRRVIEGVHVRRLVQRELKLRRRWARIR